MRLSIPARRTVKPISRRGGPAMTFDEYWAGQGEPLASDSAARAIAMMAWDAALCAAQSLNYDTRGRIRPALEIAATLSDLHTWVKPATMNAPSSPAKTLP
jgi:hypothetical protein